MAEPDSAGPAGSPTRDRDPLEVPVLFLVFNRPEPTRRVFDAIRGVRPRRLFVASDGPRAGWAGEADAVAEVRETVLSGIDWDCEVKTLFRDENLGLARAVGGAITWFFEAVEEGIVLEDDCLPDPSFFAYCEALLDRFRDDRSVMHISGGCHLDAPDVGGSYYLSRYPHIWGWATWADSWQEFSPSAPELEADLRRVIPSLPTTAERRHWEWIFRQTDAGRIDSWSYFWILSVWRQGGLSVYPTRNLVRNIGFVPEAVHTKAWKDYKGLRDLPLESMPEVIHPESPQLRPDLDLEDFRRYFLKPSFPVRAAKVLRRSAGHLLDTVRGRRDAA